MVIIAEETADGLANRYFRIHRKTIFTSRVVGVVMVTPQDTDYRYICLTPDMDTAVRFNLSWIDAVRKVTCGMIVRK